MNSSAKIPSPGSDKAIEQGCTCPVMDNNNGRGNHRGPDGKMNFVWNLDCPLHFWKKKETHVQEPEQP